MIFTFLKQSYSRRNKKWADFGCILKTEPTGATHALNLVIKKGKSRVFSEILAEQPEEQNFHQAR